MYRNVQTRELEDKRVTDLGCTQDVHGVLYLLQQVGAVQQPLEYHLADQVVSGEAVEVIHGELQVACTQLLIRHAATTVASIHLRVERPTNYYCNSDYKRV